MADGVKQMQRRDLEANWVLSNYVLDEGEFGLSTDTGIIKFGDGLTAWTDLPPAFEDYYLPKLGTAANAELLGGISKDGFLKFADTDVDPDPNKIAQRDAAGRLKVVSGVADDDVATIAQLTANKRELVSRIVTAATTFALGDIAKMLVVNHASMTAQVVVTIPTNATVAIPVGSWVDIQVIGDGGAKLTPAGGVTVNGTTNVFSPFGIIRLFKTATDAWMGVNTGGVKRLPQIRVYKNAGGTSYANATDIAVPWTTIDTANTYNPDSEWFTIPVAGLATARRIVANKTGLYGVVVNTSVTTREQSWIKINKMTADNVIGAELGVGPTFWNGQAIYQGRLTAGESIGAVFYNGKGTGATTDEADGFSGHRNDMVIVRLAD